MYVAVQNENYGYAVATHGKYVGVGNPELGRYDLATASFYRTGSFDVFRYDVNTDTHFYVETIKKPFDPEEAILLAAETQSFIKSASLQTEPLGFDVVNRNKDIAIDDGLYIQNLENAYGTALDCFDYRFAVGCKYFWDQVVIGGEIFDSSGSCVDIWDYTFKERNQFIVNDPINQVGAGLVIGGVVFTSVGTGSNLNFQGYDTGSHNVFWANYQVPPGYDEVWIYGYSTDPSQIFRVSQLPVDIMGGYVTFFYDLTLPSFFVTDVIGYIQTTTKRFHIQNPDILCSSSFGAAVSLNDKWLVIGSPYMSSSQGMAYVFINETTGSNLSWSLYQRVTASVPTNGQLFGWDVSINKSIDFSCPDRFVVGCGAPNNNTVYLYELSGSVWVDTHEFHQDTSSLYPLTFDTGSYPILLSSSYQTSSFGWAVSTWEDTVVIGAPRERQILEYTGSPEFDQGTAYIFERCPGYPCASTASYRLDKKIYGDIYGLKNNRLGYAVSVYGDNLLIGVPRQNVVDMTSCYLQNSLIQQHYCDADLENSIHGQWLYFTRNTESMEWDFSKTFQKKKKFMEPFRALGEDVAVGDLSIVIGAPMLISDLNRSFNVPYTESLGIPLSDVMGKAYIYNLHNYKDKFFIGNVFYRNGTLVINTSGSAFEGLYFNPASPYTYEYLWDYQSKHTIYEKQIVCTANPGEFNVSTNPTAIDLPMSVFDLNHNGKFDFQDADVLLRYMQYKNSTTLGGYSFDWSSSVVDAPDEVSYYNYNFGLWTGTDSLFTSSLKRFETTDTEFASLLDLNQDNKIDIHDMLIFWNYVSNRLTEKNYLSFINTNCSRKQVSDAIVYLDNLSQRNATPMISKEFFNFDTNSAADPTGSFLAPMVTTIGLYDGLDLVAVAKLGSPIKLPKTLPINFVVKMDF